jgi:hypothetical protein
MNDREVLAIVWTWFFSVRHSDFHNYKANRLGVIKIGARLSGRWIVAAEIEVEEFIEICCPD